MHRNAFAVSCWLVLQAGAGGAEAEPTIPPAAGPFVNLTESDFREARSYSSNARIVGTYYFYWYDETTGEHFVDGDGSDALTTHPPAAETVSYKSVRWHRRQLEDMMDAGIDVVLPVFWGAPSEQNPRASLRWSYQGLPPLVQAREECLAAGKSPPRIGLLYDTSTLQHNAWRQHIDLTKEYGRSWFYATIRDFFSLIPARHWAMIDGKPIVLLYSAAFARAHDQSCIDFTWQRFPREFGGRVPWIAREVSWRVKADSVVAWGGALGLRNPGGIASLGPGYDHSAVPDREPLVVDRRGGGFYEEQWLRLLRRPARFVMVETWNEWHEGTDVAESKEYGRLYIELTRKYADLFRQGWRPSAPAGRYTDMSAVSIVLGETNVESGLKLVANEDGVTRPDDFAGRSAHAAVRSGNRGTYFYFVADESFKAKSAADYTVGVEYFDAAPGRLGLEFDGSDESAPFSGAYSASPDRIVLGGERQWKKASFRVPAARFLNGQNGGADLRLVVEATAMGVGRVDLRRSIPENVTK
jgi:hypothetical protein